MKERPIIFGAESVRAILEGRKTQTRRVIKPSWSRCLDLDDDPDDREKARLGCPYGKPGNRLWVRETWGYTAKWPPSLAKQQQALPTYKADQPDGGHSWFSSIHMPRWASRITLEVTEVRVERLQEISPNDARDEGVPPYSPLHPLPAALYYQATFQDQWDALNAKRGFSWESNPWVWVVSFRRVEA